VADRFRASPPVPTETESSVPGGGSGFPDLLGDLNSVREGFEHFGLLDDRVRFLQGAFPDTLPEATASTIALLRIGAGIGAEAGEVLAAWYDRVAVGGFVIVDDFVNAACAEAVEQFRVRHGIAEPIERIDAIGVVWRKTEPTATVALAPAEHPARAPLAPPSPITRKDLSVIIVFYNMKREATRTLHSLSRAYQQGTEDLDYEVIVVENGSSEDQKLGEEFVRSFGPEFRYVDMGADAMASPVHALNRGIALASGDAFALMIDGAHVLTPGVLRFGMVGLQTYGDSIVATQQWFVGPGQQSDELLRGYDQDMEDRLFEEINWPMDGYRLFDIGVFIGDRDWFDGVWESNCLFAPRRLLEQVGGFEESFTQPGGGYANLELYERLGSAPDINVTTILGEGSFHQTHGGTTTNQSYDERRRRIGSYADHYEEMRGRPFRGPGKLMHYVGSMPPGAIRTKPRRRVGPNVFKAAGTDPEGVPTVALPMPQGLRSEFIEAFWRSLAWRDTKWLGQPVHQAPTDLFAYQELIARLRPDWIIETRSANGGRALFLASICELVGHGQVLSIDAKANEKRPQHPRITYLAGRPDDPATADRVRELVGEHPNALVVLGTREKRQKLVHEFGLYSPLVPVGGYVVVEDTIVNGHPVWPTYGPGPAEAVKNVLNSRGDFAPDPSMEKDGLTFNPGGFLRRLS
jgi:cephalosporin hydroxylase